MISQLKASVIRLLSHIFLNNNPNRNTGIISNPMISRTAYPDGSIKYYEDENPHYTHINTNINAQIAKYSKGRTVPTDDINLR